MQTQASSQLVCFRDNPVDLSSSTLQSLLFTRLDLIHNYRTRQLLFSFPLWWKRLAFGPHILSTQLLIGPQPEVLLLLNWLGGTCCSNFLCRFGPTMLRWCYDTWALQGGDNDFPSLNTQFACSCRVTCRCIVV